MCPPGKGNIRRVTFQNYSLDFQYEIGRNLVLELGYAGNQSRKLLYGIGLNANQMPANLLSMGSALDQQVNNPFYGEITSGILAGRTVARHRLLRPYPQFNSVNLPSDTQAQAITRWWPR